MAKVKKESRVKKFFGEFKKFITRGNVLDMAVGVIVGGAFTAIVNGLSNFILKPLINWLIAAILGKDGLAGAITMLSPAYKDVLGADGATVIGQELDLAASIYIDWGSFISAIINFFLIALVLFSIVRIINRVREANDKMEQGFVAEWNEKKAIKKLAKSEKVKWAQAKALYEERKAAAAAEKAAAEQKAAEQAALEAKLAEDKAMANTRLLEEIRDLLKQNSAK
ncbi:MAG: large conductance mechanosensitive channel protein MscL [Clostridia bacterium]|nr:large conductance mechanosensitive channel protein MscL [Clostridia bacterium]